MGLDVVHQGIDLGEGHGEVGVRRAIVDGDAAGVGVLEGGAGEAHAGHEALLLIPLLGGQQEVLAAILHLAGLVDVQDGRAEGIDEAGAGAGRAVVEQQPALAGLDGRGAGADLHALPPLAAAGHHVAVHAPELHVRALAEPDVAEGGVPAVRGSGQQLIAPVHPPGEQHRVAVEGDEGILQAREGLEIGGLRHADGRAVVVLAPHGVPGVLHLHQPRVVGVAGHQRRAALVREGHGRVLDVPVDAVGAAAQVDQRDAVGALAAEQGDEPALIGRGGGVEHPRHPGQRIAADDGILAVAPDGGVVAVVRGAILPGDVRQALTIQDLDLGHGYPNLSDSFRGNRQ